MAERSFVDTNVLIYAEARDEPIKQQLALTLLRQLFDEMRGVLSTQVLQEYCNVALKRLNLPAAHVRAQLDWYEQFEIVQVTPTLIHAALDLHQTRSVGFYDAIILASAQASGCKVLLSEDMNAGEVVRDVRIVNPFAASVPPPQMRKAARKPPRKT